MGWLQRFFDRILTSVTQEPMPEIIFLPDLATWVVRKTRTLHASRSLDYPQEITQTKKVRSCMGLAQELQALDSKRNMKLAQLRVSKERLQNLVLQKDEKEVTLLKSKDTPEYQAISASFEAEKNLLKEREIIDDELFLFLVRIKTSLSELQDFNSNYELLDVVNAVTKVQENFQLFFVDQAYNTLKEQLRWVSLALKSGTLREKIDGQYLFAKLFEEFQSGNFVQKRDTRIGYSQEIRKLGQERMRQDVYSKIEDLKYRIDHFTEQQEALEMHIAQLTTDFDHIATKLEEMKIAFEKLAHATFDVQMNVALASSIPH